MNVREFQQNCSFLAFMCLVVFASLVYTTKTLRDVIVPLAWSAFFAVPLVGLIERIDRFTIKFCDWLCGSGIGSDETVPFRASMGDHKVTLPRTHASLAILESVDGICGDGREQRSRSGCGLCGMRRHIAPCCQLRVRITRLRTTDGSAAGTEVNRLVESWAYYVAGHNWSKGQRSKVGEGQASQEELQLELFVDQACQYPAAIGGSVLAVGEVTGALELERRSALSWTFSCIVAVLAGLLGTLVFIGCVTHGIRSIQQNKEAYKVGINDFVRWTHNTGQRILPAATFGQLEDQASDLVGPVMERIAGALMVDLEYVGFQTFVFIMYLLFWVCEPLPFNSSVGQVFQNYLLLKTLVCALFAALMSGLLYFLQCPLWHLFFIIAFLLNYIPEVGAIASAALMVPAILFDGNMTLEERKLNTLMLVIFGTLFKIITGNLVEVQLYASMGGNYMRMHPVVMVALMMLCELLLGVTGMFLAIPIMAAIKYYMVSTEMPEVFLSPLLTVLEGDKAGPHKNFVDRARQGYGAAGKADAWAPDVEKEPAEPWAARLERPAAGEAEARPLKKP